MKLTIYRNGDTKLIGYDIGHTTGHNDSLRLDCNSREYRNITDIESDVQEVREKAADYINNLLDGGKN